MQGGLLDGKATDSGEITMTDNNISTNKLLNIVGAKVTWTLETPVNVTSYTLNTTNVDGTGYTIKLFGAAGNLLYSANPSNYNGNNPIDIKDVKQIQIVCNTNNNTWINEFDIFGYTNKYLIKDGEDIKKWDYTETYSYANQTAIPDMTGNTTPSGRAFASSVFSNSQIYNAFNNNQTYDYFTTAKSGQIGYEFPEAKKIYQYSMRSSRDGTYTKAMPKNWTFEGSNDGTNWIVLDARSNESWTSSLEVKSYTITNPQTFKMYRLNWNGNNGYSYYTQFNKLEMFEVITNKLYGWKLIDKAPATEDMFATNGMSDISNIPAAAWNQLGNTFSVLEYVNTLNTYISSLNVSYNDKFSIKRNVDITTVPFPQLLLPTEDIKVGELDSVKIDTTLSTGYSDNVIPIMTSDTAPSGKAEVSSKHSNYSNYAAYKLFDGNTTDYGWLSYAGASLPIFLTYTFPTARVITKYEVFPSAYGTENYSMKDWEFQGSNDGVTWYVLDKQTGHTEWILGVGKAFEIKNTTAYTMYRISIIEKQSTASSYVTLGEIKMYESLGGKGDIKIIVSGDSGVTWKGKEVVSPTNLEEVKENGFTPEAFNSLTEEELASLFPDGKARFAFYLEQEKSTDIVQINSVSINEIEYKIAPSVKDMSAFYETLKSERPTFYVSRNDGTDWLQIELDELTKLDRLPEGNNLRVKAVLKDGQELHGISYSWI